MKSRNRFVGNLALAAFILALSAITFLGQTAIPVPGQNPAQGRGQGARGGQRGAEAAAEPVKATAPIAKAAKAAARRWWRVNALRLSICRPLLSP